MLLVYLRNLCLTQTPDNLLLFPLNTDDVWLLWLGLWHILGTSKADVRFLYLISWTLSHPKHPVRSTLSFFICMLKGEKLLGCALILVSTLKSLPGEGCGAAACNPALVVEGRRTTFEASLGHAVSSKTRIHSKTLSQNSNQNTPRQYLLPSINSFHRRLPQALP